jgi:hypothetical protein
VQIEELPMQAFGARKRINRLRKHPVDRSLGGHFASLRVLGIWSDRANPGT